MHQFPGLVVQRRSQGFASIFVLSSERGAHIIARIPAGGKDRPRRPESERSRQVALGASTSEEDHRCP